MGQRNVCLVSGNHPFSHFCAFDITLVHDSASPVEPPREFRFTNLPRDSDTTGFNLLRDTFDIEHLTRCLSMKREIPLGC